MACDFDGHQQIPSGHVTAITFGILDDADMEKISVTSIGAVSEVSDPKLGLPNRTHECATCGAKGDARYDGGGNCVGKCEGHFGAIKFPCKILHPYFMSEVVQILNKICLGCKSVKRDQWKGEVIPWLDPLKCCKYCLRSQNQWYPTMKVKLSSRDLFKKATVTVEVSERLPKKRGSKSFSAALPADYWEFIPNDPDLQESGLNLKPNKRVLSPAQIYDILKDVDPSFIKLFTPSIDSLFLNKVLITPNCQRVTEIVQGLSFQHGLMFDDRTKAYRKLVDFRGTASELDSRVLDSLKISKLSFAKPIDAKDYLSNPSGSKWVKEVVLGKRNDHSFRMVVVGDPKIQIDEVGIPCHIAEMLQITEQLNSWNRKRLTDSCNLHLLEKGEIFVRRHGCLARIRFVDNLKIGDAISRPLFDGDIVLINRPPSIHQHSLIALKVKVLPITSVVSLNPLICPPFRGDFDGDCYHGYVPQSVESRVELGELVALDQQLFNGQSGRNLLSFSQDSLTAAHMITEDTVLLNVFEMQQLAMSCPPKPLLPAIVKVPPTNGRFWTGKQLFSMLLPEKFEFSFLPNGIHISEGELLTSSDGSAWLRDTADNFFYSILKHCHGDTLYFLYAAQEVLCEWLTMRGLTVSLSDLYLSSDRPSRQSMIDEVSCGLQEAEQTCHIKQLMVDSCLEFLIGNDEEDESAVLLDVEHLCYERQRSAALSQASVSAFKQVFREIQGLAYHYSSKDNSLLAMLKAGSKGNLLKLIQHSMCLGLQHSLVPLSFRLPHRLNCASWNRQKVHFECAQSYIPYAVVKKSFVTGLNPLELFVHSLMSRDSSFSDNADVPGTLNRRLMFFMRDICIAYDGTVRNAYGNQIVQFDYNPAKDSPISSNSNGKHEPWAGRSPLACESMAGQPVGSLAASAISEAAYSALDQPISTLEKSPLFNLKNALECGLRKLSIEQTASLFLSKKLGKWKFGHELGALEVKTHLERLLFSDVVSTVMIRFSPQIRSRTCYSPWVCHFHVCKQVAKKRRLNAYSIIEALQENWDTIRVRKKVFLPEMLLTSNCICSEAETEEEKSNMLCITATMIEISKNSHLDMDMVRDVVIPVLLQTVVKGFAEIKKVEILWKDKRPLGEIYLKVHMSEKCARKKFWSALVDNCIQIMDMIDWERSHPDDIHGVFTSYGIDMAWKYFFNRLKSAVSDTGKAILPEHLLLLANCLSSTGEFVGLNANGMARQRQKIAITSPFLQACFSTPGATLIKAAKAGVADNLQGTIDALAWGKIPAMGTGGNFDIIYSGKGCEIANPINVYGVLGRRTHFGEQHPRFKAYDSFRNKCQVDPVPNYGGSDSRKIPDLFLRRLISFDDIQKLSYQLRVILRKYSINQNLSDSDKKSLMTALYFHPQKEDKIGLGVQHIKVGHHTKFKDSRCFFIVRPDKTEEDFSYHKCVQAALEIIAPDKAKNYQSKWSRRLLM